MENNVENKENQQQENVVKQETQKNQGSQILYGGFWARLAAYFIDRLVVGVGMFILIMPLGFLLGVYSSDSSLEEGILGVVFVLLVIVIMLLSNFGYFVYMTYKYQSTLGKMAVGIKVLNDNGKKPTLSEVMMREVLGKIVSYLTMKIGYLIAAFTDKKQALHDMIGKTIVVAKDQKEGSNKVVVAVVNTCFIGFYVLVSIFYLFLMIALVAEEVADDNYSNDYYMEDYEDYSEDYSNYEF